MKTWVCINWIKKLKNAWEGGFIFNQVNKFRKRINSILSNILIHYYIKLQTPVVHRQFF